MSDFELGQICTLNESKSSFTICAGLTECQKQGIGDLEVGTRTRFTDLSRRMVLVAGRFKKDRVQLSYCPFCGGNIKTEHKPEIEVQS